MRAHVIRESSPGELLPDLAGAENLVLRLQYLTQLWSGPGTQSAGGMLFLSHCLHCVLRLLRSLLQCAPGAH